MRRTYTIIGISIFAMVLAGGAAIAIAQQQGGTELPNLQTTPPLPAPPRAGGTLPPPPTSIPALSTIPMPSPQAPREMTTTSLRPFTLPTAAPSKNAAFEELPREPLQAPADATGKQEPAIQLEWLGPPNAKLNQPSDYSLVIRNTSVGILQQVQTRVRLPNGLTLVSSEPKGLFDNGVMRWDVGTLQPKQEQSFKLRFVADVKGAVMPQAWVTFTAAAVLKLKVCEPRLAIKVGVPERVLVGDVATFSLSVSNPGDGAADQVRLLVNLSQGLEHPKGDKIELDIGTLAAGENRSVQLVCNARVGGPQKCDCMVEGDGGLTARDSVSVNVIQPRIDLRIAGPGLRYLGRKAIYTLHVTNPGDAPAASVTLAEVVPAGFKVLAASDGGRYDVAKQTVTWYLGDVGPNQSREVKMEVLATGPGEFEHKATVLAARGLKAESKLLTRIEGLSAIMLEMVDTEDPIEVGGETSYEVRVTNTGSKTETDIRLVATVPDKMELKSADCPPGVRYRAEGKVIVFDPLDKLAPKADALFRIKVKASKRAQFASRLK